MFDWFDKTFRRRGYLKDDRTDVEKIGDDINKVIPFPELKTVPPMPEVKPPKEESGKVFYRFGVTDNNRVAFSMGHMEITMNKEGCRALIDQLTFFMNQIPEDDNE